MKSGQVTEIFNIILIPLLIGWAYSKVIIEIADDLWYSLVFHNFTWFSQVIIVFVLTILGSSNFLVWERDIFQNWKKLDGVGPVGNRPSTNQLHPFVQFL